MTASQKIQEAVESQGWEDLADKIRSGNRQAAMWMIEQIVDASRKSTVEDIVIDLTACKETSAVKVVTSNYL